MIACGVLEIGEQAAVVILHDNTTHLALETRDFHNLGLTSKAKTGSLPSSQLLTSRKPRWGEGELGGHRAAGQSLPTAGQTLQAQSLTVGCQWSRAMCCLEQACSEPSVARVSVVHSHQSPLVSWALGYRGPAWSWERAGNTISPQCTSGLCGSRSSPPG